MTILWLACAAWSLLDLKPTTSSHASRYGWLCTLCTGGWIFRPFAARMCDVSIAARYHSGFCTTTARTIWRRTCSCLSLRGGLVDGHQKAGAQLQRKGFDSLAFLVVMERKKSTCSWQSRTSTSGSEEARGWARAGFVGISTPSRRRLWFLVSFVFWHVRLLFV
jgi:hypothetical protein